MTEHLSDSLAKAASDITEEEALLVRRLRWQCRRGIKEVEMFLEPFFEQHFLRLSDAQKTVFQGLLLCSDADLFVWLTTQEEPEDNMALSEMINTIRQCNDSPPLK